MMMDYNKIKNSEDLKNLNASSILDEENFEAIKYRACDYIDSLDWDGAVSFARTLEEKLERLQLDNSEEQIGLNVLRFWVLKLRLFSFSNLSVLEQKDLLKDHAAFIIQSGLDLNRVITRYFSFFASEKIIKEESKSLIFALNNNKENLGTQIDEFQKFNFRPTVGNWIREYQTVFKSSADMNMEPGAFHIVKFLDTNSYVKYLTSEEKDVLKELLELYNWLSSPIAYVEERQAAKKETTPYITQERFVIPEESPPQLKNYNAIPVEDEEVGSSAKVAGSVGGGQAESEGNKEEIPVATVQFGRSEEAVEAVQAPAVAPKPKFGFNVKVPPRTVNMDEILAKKAREEKEDVIVVKVDIDEKLAELKTRKERNAKIAK